MELLWTSLVFLLYFVTISSANRSCTDSEFTCGNGLCIPKIWHCDGDLDCDTDEQNCGPPICDPSMFTCGNGKCIQENWRCDGEIDCDTDEENCYPPCGLGFFTCGDGKCISMRFRCDYQFDCNDKSDELDCPERNCTSLQMFACENGQCIPRFWHCDGATDCGDGSDEKNCIGNETSDEIDSRNKTINEMSNNSNEMSNKSNEINNDKNETWICGVNEFQCVNQIDCTLNMSRCDGEKDCPDGSDEKNCLNDMSTRKPNTKFSTNDNETTCPHWMFTCQNKRCRPLWWKCDGINDCGDNSDEGGCEPTPVPKSFSTEVDPKVSIRCKQTEFLCESGECIPGNWVCDKSRDCGNGEDERACYWSNKCTLDEFKCQVDGSCIQNFLLCNDYPDCPDGSDEVSCITDDNLVSKQATSSCPSGFFRCDENVCMPLTFLCDIKTDCIDQSDEMYCGDQTRIYQVMHLDVDKREIETSLLLFWRIRTSETVKLEFLPSISKVGESTWTNITWIEHSEFRFLNLEPYTKYNMTVYVRENTTVFPPANYFVATTAEGIPSEPWNLSVQQKTNNQIFLSWNSPKHPNGNIQFYEVSISPPHPPMKLDTKDNRTDVLLTNKFTPGENYSFSLIAFNKGHKSEPSDIQSVTFESDFDMESVKNIFVSDNTNSTITLTWRYSMKVEGFNITVTCIGGQWPKFPVWTTNETFVTIGNLGPGSTYSIKVFTFRKTFIGPETSIVAKTSGTPLPEVIILHAWPVENAAPTIELKWNRPEDTREVNWEYGVYYGTNISELQEGYKFSTLNLMANVTRLFACEKYYFSVGIIGPLGTGKLSKVKMVNTQFNEMASPVGLRVEKDLNDDASMRMYWEPSCAYVKRSLEYEVLIHEKTMGTYQFFNTTKTENTYETIDGGIYEVKVRTNKLNSVFTNNVVYYAGTKDKKEVID